MERKMATRGRATGREDFEAVVVAAPGVIAQSTRPRFPPSPGLPSNAQCTYDGHVESGLFWVTIYEHKGEAGVASRSEVTLQGC